MYTFDHDLFLALNFDGGPIVDRIMLIISGTPMWLPLYALILWMVYRKEGWRNLLLFIAAMVLAIVLSDIICGIFKHTGLLKNLWTSFPVRLRPMFEPLLEGQVHFPQEALGGLYGTVSAHAAVIVALAAVSIPIIRRWWFTALMIVSVLMICYSRIYLAKHYPGDLVLGTGVGLLCGYAMLRLYRTIKARIQKA